HGGATLAVASDRPTALDGGAEETARYEPGNASGFLAALAAELAGNKRFEGEAGADAERIGGALRPGSTVIVWGERVGHGLAGPAALGELLGCARALDAKLLEVPDGANTRGVGEGGCLPGIGPGLSEVPAGNSERLSCS